MQPLGELGAPSPPPQMEQPIQMQQMMEQNQDGPSIPLKDAI